MTDSNDPVALKRLVDNLTKVIELGEKTKLNQMQLRWEFTRQLHLAMPKFWLEGKTASQLMILYNTHYDEYEEVFGKLRPRSCGSIAEDVHCWVIWQKRRWEKAQVEMVTA